MGQRIGCVCRALSKAHPVEELFEEHTDPMNRVMKYSCMAIYNKVYSPDNPCFSLHIYFVFLQWSTMSMSKGRAVEERFEAHSDLSNMVMKDTCMPICNKAYTPGNTCFFLHIYAASVHCSTTSIPSVTATLSLRDSRNTKITICCCLIVD